MTILFNFPIFIFIAENTSIYSLSGATIALSIFSLIFTLTLVFSSLLILISPLFFKIFLAISTILNAISIYFMITYQVVLDRSMMGNIINTRYSESVELLSLQLVFFTLCFGVIPAWFVIRTKVYNLNRLKVCTNLSIVVITSSLFLYLNASSWLWIDKYASLIGGKILPWSYIINTGRHYSSINKTTAGQRLLPDGKFSNTDKMVFVLVIGETARSDNFSLYGYPKNTNPQLQQLSNLLVLKNTKSCTTYTTGSLACILSHSESISNTESLPTYLARNGAEVIWRSNNWGSQQLRFLVILMRVS